MPVLPMFPLGSVLLPGMPLALQIFEDRYLTMMTELPAERPEFGVVLIERGREVGGDDQRFGIGTVARVVRLTLDQGALHLLALGERRFRVTRWLPDDPYPKAEVEWLPALTWTTDLRERFEHAERTVRMGLARASEFHDRHWPSDVGLADDPVVAAWQLAGIAPLGPLDQVALLRSETAAALLSELTLLTDQAIDTLEMTGVDGLLLTDDDE